MTSTMTDLITGVKAFIEDMQTITAPVTIWASLFPFPQIFVGGYLSATRGFSVRHGGWCAFRMGCNNVAAHRSARLAGVCQDLLPITVLYLRLLRLGTLGRGLRPSSSQDRCSSPVWVTDTTSHICMHAHTHDSKSRSLTHANEQFSVRRPGWKLMAPAMHAPFFLVVPLTIR